MNLYVWTVLVFLVIGSIGWLEKNVSNQDKTSPQYIGPKSYEDTIIWRSKLKLGATEDVDRDSITFQEKVHKHISFLEGKLENRIVSKKGIEVPQHTKKFLKSDTVLGYKHREKRDSNNLFRVDSLLIIDFSLFERWRDVISNYFSNSSVGIDVVLELIRNFYTLLIDRVNRRFSQLDDSQMLLRIYVKDIYIAYSIDKSPWNTTTESNLSSSLSSPEIGARRAQEELYNWLKGGSYLIIRDYNLVVGLTAMTLLDDRNQTLQGISQIGSVCQEPNVVVMRDTFDFILGTVASHHIARSLGASEDGKENNCSAHDQFIMSTPSVARTGQTKSNPWIFSGCTGIEIREYLFALSNICLPKIANSAVIPAYTGTLPGSRLTADQQCQIIESRNSYMCRVMLGGRYEEICTGMYCLSPTDGSCKLVVPHEGTSCADGKVVELWCINGACVSSPRAPLAPDKCVHGDQPVVDFSTGGCRPHIVNAKSECYNRTISLACCQSCLAVSSNTEGCEYGDRENCSVIEARSCYNDQVFRRCCRTCPSYGTGIQDCLYGNRIASCALISGRDCYDENTNRDCCQTCLSHKRDDSKCPYGDSVSGCHRYECSSYSEGRLIQCCDTCSGSETTTDAQTSKRNSVTIDYVTSTNITSTAAPMKEWVGPVIGTSIGVLVIAAIVVACTVYYTPCRQRCCKAPPGQAQTYDQEKLDQRVSDRPPMPPPRDVQELDLFSEGDGEETYAYIHTNDIEDTPGGANSTGGSDSSGSYIKYASNGSAHEYLDLVRSEPYLVLPSYKEEAATRGEGKDENNTKFRTDRVSRKFGVDSLDHTRL